MSANFELRGVRTLQKQLQALDKKVATKITRQALREASKIVQKQAKANAPVGDGQLKKAIKVRAAKRKKGRIGLNVQTGKGDYKGDTFYGAFQEYGWTEDTKDGPRKIPGKYYMRKAFITKGKEARQVALELMREAIEREAKKAA